MRRSISTLILLSLALNGIACACPVDVAATDDSAHAQHSSQHADDATSENCHGSKCASECGEISVSKSHRQAVAISNYSVEPDQEPDLQTTSNSSALSLWLIGSALRIPLHIDDRSLPNRSPVALKDRMLH